MLSLNTYFQYAPSIEIDALVEDMYALAQAPPSDPDESVAELHITGPDDEGVIKVSLYTLQHPLEFEHILKEIGSLLPMGLFAEFDYDGDRYTEYFGPEPARKKALSRRTLDTIVGELSNLVTEDRQTLLEHLQQPA